jgi:hypothetical protein
LGVNPGTGAASSNRSSITTDVLDHPCPSPRKKTKFGRWAFEAAAGAVEGRAPAVCANETHVIDIATTNPMNDLIFMPDSCSSHPP